MSRCPTEGMKEVFSHSLADPDWDAFLQSTSLGQYQQSTMWARYKASEGWQPLRYLFTNDGRILGGFQILCKETRFGRVGYVPKGPVLPEGGPIDYDERAIDLMVRAAHDHDLRALIAQPPDDCAEASAILKGKGFIGSPLLDVIDSTLVIPLDNGLDDVLRGMDPETRRKIRQARKNDVSIRECGTEDLPIFFELMASTCRRQSTRPNPSNPSRLQALWDAFRPSHRIEITFAEHNGETLAGVLCIRFGNRVTLWKKGWSESGGEFRPNDFLHEYAISKAYRDRFAVFDFAGLNRGIALSLASGKPLSASQKKSRDVFNLRFGGVPKLLPQATIYIKSNLLRHAFRFIGTRFHTAPSIFR